MSKNLVITIGRQYGSGGRSIGKQIAKDLGIDFYDKDIIKIAAKESGICEELFEGADEKPINSLLYSIVAHGFPAYSSPGQFVNTLSNDRLFAIQADVIKEIAKKSSCVIVGRCADDILKDEDIDLISVFIHLDKNLRFEEIKKRHNLSDKEAKETLRRVDKSRANYYEFYSNLDWGKAENYDLAINAKIGEKNSIEIIKSYVKIKNGEKNV